MATKPTHLIAVGGTTTTQFAITDGNSPVDPYADERSLQDKIHILLSERRHLLTRINQIDADLLKDAASLDACRGNRGGTYKVEAIEGMLRYLPPVNR